MKSVSIKLLVTGILLFFIGSCTFYLFGYKDRTLIDTVSLSSVLLGWILFVGAFISTKKQIVDSTVSVEKASRLKGCLGQLAAVGFFFLFFAYILFLFFLQDDRVKKILTSQPTKYTVATVIKLTERLGKYKSQPYAVLNYQAGTENMIVEISAGHHSFIIGEKVTIKYSVEYPDMFKMTEKQQQ